VGAGKVAAVTENMPAIATSSQPHIGAIIHTCRNPFPNSFSFPFKIPQKYIFPESNYLSN